MAAGTSRGSDVTGRVYLECSACGCSTVVPVTTVGYFYECHCHTDEVPHSVCVLGPMAFLYLSASGLKIATLPGGAKNLSCDALRARATEDPISSCRENAGWRETAMFASSSSP